ncbi:hypothetical protein CSB92_0229 [Pseudomonas aeruginosa]|nr:hypothetical protein CSC27_4016 [Pseudomonas aeruginosa]PRW13413.1 hypothetical protein CSB92_0229 [Pseudomonas aeruginosa]
MDDWHDADDRLAGSGQVKLLFAKISPPYENREPHPALFCGSHEFLETIYHAGQGNGGLSRT